MSTTVRHPEPLVAFQGNPGVFDAHSGSTDSYIAANYLNAGPGGNVSNWLISPVLLLDQYTNITFYTRTENPAVYADSIEVRISTNGASTDVGATDTSVGDFSTLILSVNPLLDPAGYPTSWTKVSATLSSAGEPGERPDRNPVRVAGYQHQWRLHRNRLAQPFRRA
ncbi:MAG: choice-of-anchor J domain-containing protein [Paludibaculum sp.]